MSKTRKSSSKAESRRRSAAAKKAWAERKKREAAESRKRSLAAKRGWQKRKAVQKKPAKKKVVPSTRARSEKARLKALIEKARKAGLKAGVKAGKKLGKQQAKRDFDKRIQAIVNKVRRVLKTAEATEREDLDNVWKQLGFKTTRMHRVLEQLRKAGKITWARAIYDIADEYGVEPREIFRWYFGY
jgi:hypothetical protein